MRNQCAICDAGDDEQHVALAHLMKSSAINARKDPAFVGAVIVLDFTSFLVSKVSGNVLVAEVVIPSLGRQACKVFLFVSERNEDVFFVHQGVEVILSCIANVIDRVTVFSDGAPQHFRNSSNVIEWGNQKVRFPWLKSILLCFFCFKSWILHV